MIEIVFSESAGGSLKAAQTYGKGEWSASSIGMIGTEMDPAGETELRKALQEAEQKEREAWEQAIPLGGNPADVFSFPLALGTGDIAEAGVGSKRLEVLRRLFAPYPENVWRPAADEIYREAVENYQKVKARLAAGETVRIWYSDQPDEMSGLYWFAAQLECWEAPADRVVLVKLEPWVLQEDRVAGYKEWGEVEPGEWGKHLSSRKTVSQAFLTGISRRWKELQGEHAVLRAVVDGRLCSVPEDFYDPWIRKAADEQEDEFLESRLIGDVIGKHQLRISDKWVFLRVEKMIEDGKLQILTEAPEDLPVYHRMLKKTGSV